MMGLKPWIADHGTIA